MTQEQEEIKIFNRRIEERQKQIDEMIKMSTKNLEQENEFFCNICGQTCEEWEYQEYMSHEKCTLEQ